MRFLLLLWPALGSLAAQTPDIDAIVKRSLEREMRNVRALDDYTYEMGQKTTTFDGSGKVKKTETKVVEVLQVDGTRYRKLISENGQTLTGTRAAREQTKLDKEMARRRSESAGARQKRLDTERKQREEAQSVREDIARGFKFTLVGEEAVGGAACWRVHAEPKAASGAKSDIGRRVMGKMRGDFWVAKNTYEWLRVEAETLDTIRFGGFLASLAKGAKFRMEQAQVAPDLWHPRKFDLRLNARALVMSFNVAEEVEYRNFRKFSAESKLLPAEEPKESGSK